MGRSLQEGPILTVQHGCDLYSRMLADVFVKNQKVAESLNVKEAARSR